MSGFQKNMIPEIINGFHLYHGVGTDGKEGEMFLGVSGEITLPELNAMTETISGSGMLGEMEVGNPGHFSAIDMEIPFIGMSSDMLTFSPTEYNTFILRMTQQSTVKDTREKDYTHMKIVVGGTMKSLKLGAAKIGGQMGSSVTLSVTYIKISVENDTLIELDKLNEIYIVDGRDQLAKIRDYS